MVSAVDAINKIDSLEARLEAKKADLRDLATMGAVVTSIQEIDTVLSVVMEMAIRLVNGEVGLIMLEDEGVLKVKASWGIQESFVRTLMYRDDQDLPTYCFGHQETVILNDLGIKQENGIVVESIICSPIRTSSTCYGILIVINKASGEGFDSESSEVLEMLLNFVAVSIDNSILVKEKLLKQAMDQEIAIARQIQETILPKNIGDIKGAEIGAVYYPAREVSGDFYDTVQIDDSRFVVILGDVSNKGIPAALVMSAASGIISTILADRPDIEMNDLAARLNDVLSKDIIREREMFITLWFGKFDLEKYELSYCNAGHMPGLFWDEEAKAICELGEGGPIVGQFPELQFKLGKRKLGHGDRLFLYTDGLTEAADDQGNLFGRERTEQVLTAEIGLSPKDFCVRVKEWVDNFAVGSSEDTHDDFTIMQVKVD